MRRVCVLVEAGSAPGRNPLLGPLRGELARADVELVQWDATEPYPLPPEPPDADLYLLKGDHPAVLSAAACLADAGAACLNDYEATAAAADKARTLARLARAGLPVPQSAVATDAGQLGELLANGARFVKPVRGAHADGAGRLASGDSPPDGAGPWLVQEAIDGPGYDVKAYGAGAHVAFRRVRVSPGVVDSPREPLERVDPALPRLALRAAEAAGLTCFGADFVLGPDGPVLVDVNAFPGYRGVAEAPAWVAAAILAALEEAR